MTKSQSINVPSAGPRQRMTHKERTDLSDSKMFEACEQLILEVGTQKTTLKEVGERAGYSRGLANARFGNKETLFLTLSDRCRRLWFDEVKKSSNGKRGLSAFMSRIEAAANFSEQYPNDARVMYILWFESVGASSEMKDGLSLFHKQARQDVTRLIEEAKALGEIADDIAPADFATYFTSTMFGLAYQYVVSPEVVKFSDFMNALKTQALLVLRPKNQVF